MDLVMIEYSYLGVVSRASFAASRPLGGKGSSHKSESEDRD